MEIILINGSASKCHHVRNRGLRDLFEHICTSPKSVAIGSHKRCKPLFVHYGLPQPALCSHRPHSLLLSCFYCNNSNRELFKLLFHIQKLFTAQNQYLPSLLLFCLQEGFLFEKCKHKYCTTNTIRNNIQEMECKERQDTTEKLISKEINKTQGKQKKKESQMGRSKEKYWSVVSKLHLPYSIFYVNITWL